MVGTKSEKTKLILVYGIVQGVGFRPFVFRLAKKYLLTGTVRNLGGLVEIKTTATDVTLELFLKELRSGEIGAGITELVITDIEFCSFEDFSIVDSSSFSESNTLSPDLTVCRQCEQDLLKKGNRRYHNPFVSCMSCGPRYTIMKMLPYDRENTVMSEFPLCKSCQKDYFDPENRRFYAQTVCCNHCGPELFCKQNGKTYQGEAALHIAINSLKNGNIIAVKGIGGFHFACSPFGDRAVETLRLLKGREQKPFSVMFETLKDIKQFCKVTMEEAALLQSSARPIVLLEKKEFPLKHFSFETDKGSLSVGAFLPYTPLQKLLLRECGPLLMTSANTSGQPILKDNEDIFSLKSTNIDCILYHNREILRSVEDSVARVVCKKPQILRRSRGIVPSPVSLPFEKCYFDIFAAGGDLKAAFCLYRNGNAFLSQYFGDLEDYKTFENYKRSIEEVKELLFIKPRLFVSDLHPLYYSSDFTKSLGGKLLFIQHHHAHIASVMAEHQLTEKVIGVAFDGTGYGTDGTVWGGEFLVCEKSEYRRAGSLFPTPLIGGDSSMKDAEKTADCFLFSAGLPLCSQDSSLLKSALSQKIGTMDSSSMGRLFDAVSAILDIKTTNDYEGQCAAELEKQAVLAKREKKRPIKLRFSISSGERVQIDPKPLIKKLHQLKDKTEKDRLALGFHYAVRDMIVSVCRLLREKEQCEKVALSGGVFQNKLLTESTVKKLRSSGFQVYLNEKVPPNDGGICLGQIYVALYSQSFTQVSTAGNPPKP